MLCVTLGVRYLSMNPKLRNMQVNLNGSWRNWYRTDLETYWIYGDIVVFEFKQKTHTEVTTYMRFSNFTASKDNWSNINTLIDWVLEPHNINPHVCFNACEFYRYRRSGAIILLQSPRCAKIGWVGHIVPPLSLHNNLYKNRGYFVVFVLVRTRKTIIYLGIRQSVRSKP